MMRVTSFFAQRQSGWSETWYLNGRPEFADAFAAAALVNSKRLRLLGTDGELIGVRCGYTEGVRTSRVKTFANMAGASLETSDVPFLALLFRVATVAAVTRSVLLRGTPDEVVKNGVYVGTSAYNAAITDYFLALKQNGFGLRIAAITQLPVDLVRVAANGLVTTNVNHTYAINDRVRFFRTRDVNNFPVTGLWKIAAPFSVDTFTIPNWEQGRTVINGQVKRYLPDFSALDNYPGENKAYIGPIRVVSRKVGRLFNSPVGRRRRR